MEGPSAGAHKVPGCAHLSITLTTACRPDGNLSAGLTDLGVQVPFTSAALLLPHTPDPVPSALVPQACVLRVPPQTFVISPSLSTARPRPTHLPWGA